ncbi:MAG: hypothetical protein J5I99_00490 [Verrucomicrobia bacterium]|nr:hypothetical protein [Kiritimatiellia bacterium]MCO6399689.1 hypothetical protein [Verrucomicrobiota bacterium]
MGSNPISRSTFMPYAASIPDVKNLFFILALFLGIAISSASAQQGLEENIAEAYKVSIQADLARDREAFADAQRLYGEAADLYSAIAQKDPNWQASVIQHRIAYCRSQLEAVKGRTGSGPSADALAATADVALAEAQQRIAQLSVENEALREENQKIKETQVSLEADMEAVQKARLEAPELAAAQNEARALLEQITLISNQLVAIDLQYREATNQLMEARASADGLQEQLKQAKADSKELEKLRKANEKLEKDLKSARDSAKKKRGEAEAAAETEWESLKTSLQAELNDCRTAGEALTAQLATAHEQAAAFSGNAKDDDALPKIKADLEQVRAALNESSRRIAESRAAALQLLQSAPTPAK